jgi:hypothetical protein
MTFDMLEALSSKLFDGGVQWLHDPQHSGQTAPLKFALTQTSKKGDRPLGAL